MEENEKVGYRVTYFGDDWNHKDGIPGLPDYLICDDSLDENLDKIAEFLKSWMEKEDPEKPWDEQLRHVHIDFIGPMQVPGLFRDRRTPEQRLSEADSPEERFEALGDAARSRFEAGDLEASRAYIVEFERMLPTFEEHMEYFRFAEIVHSGFGRLALKEGNIEEAKRRLIESAKGDGSPTMCSFGPNMSLAKDLLEVGERQIVLDYFEECRNFWESHLDTLDEWTIYVNAGRIPDFGANLVY